MSDEQPTGAVTGDVHELVPQKHGGAIKRGQDLRRIEPTPAQTAQRSRKAYFQSIPRLARIAMNPAKKGKKPKHKTSDQIAAARVLAQFGQDDTISVSDFRRAMKGFSEDILAAFPGETGERILNIAAPWFFPL